MPILVTVWVLKISIIDYAQFSNQFWIIYDLNISIIMTSLKSRKLKLNFQAMCIVILHIIHNLLKMLLIKIFKQYCYPD